MIAELTIYRCYWPTVHSYLKEMQITNFKSEAFGLLQTITCSPEVGRQLEILLPLGAMTDYVELVEEKSIAMTEIDDLLFGRVVIKGGLN